MSSSNQCNLVERILEIKKSLVNQHDNGMIVFVSEKNFLFSPRWPGSNGTVESKITCKTLACSVAVVKQK